jgi:hypothetical protein
MLSRSELNITMTIAAFFVRSGTRTCGEPPVDSAGVQKRRLPPEDLLIRDFHAARSAGIICAA